MIYIIRFLKLSAYIFLLVLLSRCKSDPTPPEIKAEMDKLPDNVDYSLQVKPLLSDRCFACHGPDKNKRQAGLRLDIKDEAYNFVSENGKHAIVSGDLGASEVFQRIISNDPKYIMPTNESHLSLNNEEKALIIKWIKEGAVYKDHWAFIAPEKKELPKVKNIKWVSNDIDKFILSKMERKNLTPSPEAEKATLLRRVSFDLTGLPPTPKELNAFINDKSPKAYEQAVNRLLSSTHYGERMASEWMDVARYADSHGYQDDGMRNVYPWRDWVIKSFNQNLSWDKFITYQLAGDMLPNPTKEQLIATCFNRNHSQSQEGGIIDEEYRTEYVADRANTFGKAFLGLTVECARCHDHKYDPISQKDYYSLFAFFNQNKESGEVPYNGEASPSIMLPDTEVEEKLKFIREKLSPAEQKINPNLLSYKKDFELWLKETHTNKNISNTLNTGLVAYFPFEGGNDSVYINALDKKINGYSAGDKDKRPKMVNGIIGQAKQLQGDCGMDFVMNIDKATSLKMKPEDKFGKGLNFERNQQFSVSAWFNILKKGLKGPLFNRNNGEFEGFRGYDVSLNTDGTLTILMSYVWPANCIELHSTDKLPINKWTNIALTYDGSGKAKGIKLFINGKESVTKVTTDHLTKSILHGEKKSNWNFMPFQIGKDFRRTIDNLQVDELRIYNRKLTSLEVESLTGDNNKISALLNTDQSKLSNLQKNNLYEFYLWNYNKEFASILSDVNKLRGEEVEIITNIPEIMVMQELPENQKRKTFILSRGAYDAPTKTEVRAHTPERLLEFNEKEYPANRLGLAKWLNNPKNPLTSRVAVNRFWMMYFGRGIVKTQEDWGNQGDMPSHPELLDWLAIKFIESGWNVKAIQKLIVMSSTYRQSSVPDKKHLELDPDNILLSRGPVFRLSAEQIRDNILRASGLLAEKIGGPSVYPYQPNGLWEALATRNKVHYEQGHGENLYRRGLYTIFKRSSPTPSLMTFDLPDRYVCTVRRQKTNTPLQSLVLMNDPQYMEAARVLGERMIKEGGKEPDKQIIFAYEALVGRYPRNEEIRLLKQYYYEELNDLKKNPAKALQVLNVGEFERDKSLNPIELAASSMVATTLINFEETVMKR